MNGNGNVTSSASPAPIAARISGTVHGGQQPVAGATIQLYAVGNTGVRSASTPLISQHVVTDANGYFNVTGLWNCTDTATYGPDPLLYIVATGGNPGLGAGGSNPALAMMTALGRCSTVTASTLIAINELSTVAAVYALAPFMSDYSHVGAASLPGLTNAFATVPTLVDMATGVTSTPSAITGLTIPAATMNTIADALGSCVNSDGTTACNALFSATSTSAPSNTIAAALNLARSPNSSPSALFGLVSPNAPFQPTLSASPSDWSLALTITGGGLSGPAGIALDASGNAWIANGSGASITGLSNQGAPLTGSTGYTAGGTIFGAQAVAVDRSGTIWLADTLLSTVVKIPVSNGIPQQSTSYSTALNAPSGIAIDSLNHVWLANFGDGSVTELDANGTPIGASPLTANGTLQAPSGIAIDSTGNVWVTDNAASTIVKFDKNQNLLSGTGFSDQAILAPTGIAMDAQGQAWVADNGSAAVSLFGAAGQPAITQPFSGGGLTMPASVAIDGSGTAWVANSATAGSVTAISQNSVISSRGSLNTPSGVAIDASGNIWTVNTGDDSVTKMIGAAAPAATPIAANVGP